MPSPEQIVRTAVVLPFSIARRVVGIAAGLLPGHGGDDEAERHEDPRSERHEDPRSAVATAPAPEPDVDPEAAAREALDRDREPGEEAIFTPDDDFFEEEHVEAEVELVAESHDVEAAEAPGPTIHVDEPWEGYRRMKVVEITAQLEGQPAEVLAAVELYEQTHRKRRGVLDAVRSATRG
jgi:hypothetical protein